MSLSYREWYRPSPHLAGAVVATLGLLAPALATWGGWTSPLPTWLVLLLGAAGLGFVTWTAVLVLRCHTALLANADGLRLHTAGGPRRSEQLTIPWAQIKEIRQGEVDTVPYLEVVRTAGAPPVPAAFSRAVVAPGSSGAGDHALLAIRDWIPDRTRLTVLASSVAPRVRFGKAVPATLWQMEEDREIDRSTRYFSQWGAFGPGTLRFILRYLGGVAAWLLFGVSLLGLWADLSAHLGHGRPGVWTAGPVACGKNHQCFVHGEFVPDDGKRARGDLALDGDSTLYRAGYRVRVLDTDRSTTSTFRATRGASGRGAWRSRSRRPSRWARGSGSSRCKRPGAAGADRPNRRAGPALLALRRPPVAGRPCGGCPLCARQRR